MPIRWMMEHQNLMYMLILYQKGCQQIPISISVGIRGSTKLMGSDPRVAIDHTSELSSNLG